MQPKDFSQKKQTDKKLRFWPDLRTISPDFNLATGTIFLRSLFRLKIASMSPLSNSKPSSRTLRFSASSDLITLCWIKAQNFKTRSDERLYQKKYWMAIYLGDCDQLSLEEPFQNHVSRWPFVFFSNGLQDRVSQDMGQLLAPGEVRGSKRRISNHLDTFALAIPPRCTENRTSLQGLKKCPMFEFFEIYHRLSLLMRGLHSAWRTEGLMKPRSRISWICFELKLDNPIDLVRPEKWIYFNDWSSASATDGTLQLTFEYKFLHCPPSVNGVQIFIKLQTTLFVLGQNLLTFLKYWN